MKIWSNSLTNQVYSLGIVAALAISTLSSAPLLADGDSDCHFHGNNPAVEATVLNCAEKHKERLIKKGTIESTWTTIKHDSVQQVDVKSGKKEWKVIFKDAFAKDKTKENLYMFFSLPGNFLATNYTGN